MIDNQVCDNLKNMGVSGLCGADSVCIRGPISQVSIAIYIELRSIYIAYLKLTTVKTHYFLHAFSAPFVTTNDRKFAVYAFACVRQANTSNCRTQIRQSKTFVFQSRFYCSGHYLYIFVTLLLYIVFFYFSTLQ